MNYATSRVSDYENPTGMEVNEWLELEEPHTQYDDDYERDEIAEDGAHEWGYVLNGLPVRYDDEERAEEAYEEWLEKEYARHNVMGEKIC